MKAKIVRGDSPCHFDADRNSTFVEFSSSCEIKRACVCALNSLGNFPSLLQLATADDAEDNGFGPEADTMSG